MHPVESLENSHTAYPIQAPVSYTHLQQIAVLVIDLDAVDHAVRRIRIGHVLQIGRALNDGRALGLAFDDDIERRARKARQVFVGAAQGEMCIRDSPNAVQFSTLVLPPLLPERPCVTELELKIPWPPLPPAPTIASYSTYGVKGAFNDVVVWPPAPPPPPQMAFELPDGT